MKLHACIAGILAATGFIAFLLTRSGLPTDNFWHPYVLATNRIALLLLIFGSIWLVLSLAHNRAQFFDLQRHMDSARFTVYMVATVVVMAVLFMSIMPKLPQTAPSQLPGEPAARQAIIRMEANFNRLVGFGILASGLAFISVPFRRFMRS